jgi:hypothetical protein
MASLTQNTNDPNAAQVDFEHPFTASIPLLDEAVLDRRLKTSS